MTMHKKHEPFDAVVHFLLGCTMWLCCALILAEARYRNNVLVTAGRAWAVLMQGIWLMQVSFFAENSSGCKCFPFNHSRYI